MLYLKTSTRQTYNSIALLMANSIDLGERELPSSVIVNPAEGAVEAGVNHSVR
jgi:hypothetical protein